MNRLARAFFASTLVAAASPAAADGQYRDELSSMRMCAIIKGDQERLACFDRVAAKLSAPRFEGRLGLSTELFDITSPTQLRYQSDGVIFVLYLKDEKGEVLQNLHIGGGGEATYLIEKPGRYSLQINGSEGWRIWLEPK